MFIKFWSFEPDFLINFFLIIKRVVRHCILVLSSIMLQNAGLYPVVRSYTSSKELVFTELKIYETHRTLTKTQSRLPAL